MAVGCMMRSVTLQSLSLLSCFFCYKRAFGQKQCWVEYIKMKRALTEFTACCMAARNSEVGKASPHAQEMNILE